MANKATTQYNGLILLTGYLQRLFVAETIYRRLNEPHDPERFKLAKSLLDEAYTIVPVFERAQSLTIEQKEQLVLIIKQTKKLMATYFKEKKHLFLSTENCYSRIFFICRATCQFRNCTFR